jgi:predicted nucleotidyltransferase
MNHAIAISAAEYKIIKTIFAETCNTDISILVFGSRTTGTHTPFSDIDICLKASKALPHALLSDLHRRFSESNLPYRVDLIDYHRLTPCFQKVINTHGINLT